MASFLRLYQASLQSLTRRRAENQRLGDEREREGGTARTRGRTPRPAPSTPSLAPPPAPPPPCPPPARRGVDRTPSSALCRLWVGLHLPKGCPGSLGPAQLGGDRSEVACPEGAKGCIGL